MSFLPIATLSLGCWMILNGVAHDFFVLKSEHGRVYNRDLLRLLMDGHILITCGIMQVISWKGLQQNQNWAYYLAGTGCISLLVYCAMIFPFLKSIGTIVLNTALLGCLIVFYFKQMSA